MPKSRDKEKIGENSNNQKSDMLSDNEHNTVNFEDKNGVERNNTSFIARLLPTGSDKPMEIVRKSVIIICALTVVVCIGIILNIYVLEPYSAKRNDSEIIDLKGNADGSEVFSNYPDVDFPEGMNPGFAGLYAKNSDFAGWLEIEGLEMEFAVVQAEDNDEYVRKNFYGQSTKYGCPFVDWRNNLSYLNRNTIIYGHNMSYDDLLFGRLEQYKTIEGFKSAPVISFDTLYESYKWKVYAAFITNADKEHDNGYVFNYIFTNVSSDAVFEEYIDELDQRKLYTTGVDIKPSDKILTLSTCTYEFRNARLVVVARMVRENESTDVDTSLAKNLSARYPQIWYDTYYDGNNPYASAKKWFPR